MRRISILLSLLLLIPGPALAQVQQARVVSSCGSASYTAGQNAATTVDTTGNQCFSGGTPVPVQPPIPATLVTGQKKIAVTGTAIQFQTASAVLVNGLGYCALTTNTNPITVGGSSVTNTVDGTGNGEVLGPGACNSKAISNANLLYLNGTAGDGLSYGGN